MKKLLAITLGALVVSTTAHAQYISGPARGTVLTNQSAAAVAGFIRTNFGINSSVVFPVGKDGVQLFITVGATNALTVTNCVATFECVGHASTNGLTAPTFTWSFPINGTSAGRYTTNFSSAYVAGQGNTALQNLSGLRLLHVTNVNSETIWITNLLWATR